MADVMEYAGKVIGSLITDNQAEAGKSFTPLF